MAMINCPECGQNISDKAKKCIHCGKILIEEEIVKEEIKCIECGTVLSENDEMCPNCGCPVENKKDEEKPQQVEVTNVKITSKTKRTIISILAVLIICAIGFVGYKTYSNNKAEQEYIANLEEVQELMFVGASDAESLCNLTLTVWYNAIYEKRDSTTDQYTRPNGYFVDDFNTALFNLFTTPSTLDTILDIEDNQVSVNDLIKKLQNPPKELNNCYDTVSDLYDVYTVLTGLAIDPSGTYSSYGEDKNDAVSEFMSTYKKLESQIPEKSDYENNKGE